MATECPVLSAHNPDTPFWKLDNRYEILPSTFNRTVGTIVEVSCFDTLELNGQSTFSCQSNGQWSYSSKPTCEDPEEAAASLDEDTRIIIGVVCGIAGLIVLLLVLVVCYTWCRDRRGKRRSDYGRRYRSSEISMDDYRRGPPPSFVSDGRYSDHRKFGSYGHSSRFGSPMYLPGRSPTYKDYYEQIKKSRRDDRDIHSDINKKPYTRDWVARSQRDVRDDYDDHYDHASIHGRYSNRDANFWRS